MAQAAILAAVLGLWGWRLLGGLEARAFDRSDPYEEFLDSHAVYRAWRGYGLGGWTGALLEQPNAKPALYALVSIAFQAGFPESPSTYKGLLGLVFILLLAAGHWAVRRSFGDRAMLLFAALTSSSNLLLAYGLWGSHTWVGQLFVWLALALASAWGWASAVAGTGRSFLIGLLLSLAVLSSYAAPPWALAVLVVWLYRWLAPPEGRGGRAPPLRPAAALLAGLAALPLGAQALPFAWGKSGFGSVWLARVRLAMDQNAQGERDPAFFLSLLSAHEPPAAVAAALVLAAAGAFLWLRSKPERRSEAAALFAVPVVAYALLALSSAPVLGRLFVPLAPFLFAAAAAGGSGLLERWCPPRGRWPAALAAAALLFASGHGRRGETLRAFFEPHRLIQEELSRAGDPHGRLVIAGYSVPFSYFQGREESATTLDELARRGAQGARWVLVSRYSNWVRRAFWDEAAPGALPVARVYSSVMPFVELPSVETLPFQRFTNSDLYHRLRRGEGPAPRPNRLYRLDDFLRACGRQ